VVTNTRSNGKDQEDLIDVGEKENAMDPKQLVGIGLLLWCSTGTVVMAQQGAQATTVNLVEPAKFKVPDGDPILIVKGEYQVEEGKTKGIRLLAVGESKGWILHTCEGEHDFRIEAPLALSIPKPEEGRHFLVFLAPIGYWLEAEGLYEGTDTHYTGCRIMRGKTITSLSITEVKRALNERRLGFKDILIPDRNF